MQRIGKLDRVQLHMAIPSESGYQMFIGQLHDLCSEHKLKLHPNPGKLGGRYVNLTAGVERLRLAVCASWGKFFLSYGFNGAIDVQAFEDLIYPLLQEGSLAHVMCHGYVARLELAVDFPGVKTSDYCFHQIGAKASHVVVNEKGNGTSFYIGSRQSDRQTIAYDKAQELIDKGKKCEFAEMLRWERRLSDSKLSMTSLLGECMSKDPFQGVLAISKNEFLSMKLPEKPSFLWTVYSEMGMAAMLRQFPHCKKQILAKLKSANVAMLSPSMNDLESEIENLLSHPCILNAAKAPPLGFWSM